MLHEHLTAAERIRFDRELEAVLAELPERVHRLLDEVPLVVDDAPSQRTMQELDVDHPDELCGLYTGVPLTDRETFSSGQLPDRVMIFRLGILAEADRAAGVDHRDELRRQIRVTILHELGHHHGLDEDDLDALGYG